MPSRRRSAVAGFCAFGAFWGGWAVLVPAVQSAVGATKGELGLALLGIGVGSVPAMALVRQVIDRRLHLILPVSFAALGLAGLLPAFAGSVATLGLALLAVGAVSGILDVAINANVAAIEAESGERLMQLAHAFFSLGVIAGALAGGALRQAGAERLAVLGLLAVVLVAVAFMHRIPRTATGGRAPRRAPLTRALVVLGAACAASFLIEGAMDNWSALFLVRELGAGAAASALGPAFFAAAMTSGRLSAQRLSRRSDAVVLAGGASLAIAGLALAAASHSVPLAVLGFFVTGAGVSVTAPLTFGAAGRGARPEERASAVAAVTTLGYLGFVVGPPIVGGIAQSLGLRAAMLALAGVAATLAAATPFLPLRRD